MILGYDHILDRNDYTFGCPEGTWIGRLDEKAWGKSRNLILYFTDQSTNCRYWLSVFDRDNYRARDGGPSFRTEAEPGELFELTTTKTRTGSPNLKSARKLAA